MVKYELLLGDNCRFRDLMGLSLGILSLFMEFIWSLVVFLIPGSAS